MSSNQKYKRYFIILENEDRGFQRDGKSVPKGYAKIEARNGKGILDLHVQDLKYYNNADYIYRSYLVNTDKDINNAVDLGSIAIDQKGKGTLKFKFDPSNVDRTDMDIEQFNVIAVVAKPLEKEGYRQIQGPLVGYIDKKKVRWKDIISIPVIENLKEDNVELEGKYKEKYDEIVDLIEKTTVEDDVEPNGTTSSENEKRDEHESADKDKTESEVVKDEAESEVVKDEDKVPGVVYLTEEDMVDSENPNTSTKRKDEEAPVTAQANPDDLKLKTVVEKTGCSTEADLVENSNNRSSKVDAQYELMNESNEKTKLKTEVYLKEYHKTVYRYLKDVLKHHRRIDPFEKNINGYKWWKIKYDQQSVYRGFLPFFGYILGSTYYNPFMMNRNNCTELLTKYGHYIFGIAYDEDIEAKHYVYGVPGRYSHNEQPFQGMTGFVTWHGMEDREAKKGDYGYWLLHIDPKAGNVVYPMKPTNPPL